REIDAIARQTTEAVRGEDGEHRDVANGEAAHAEAIQHQPGHDGERPEGQGKDAHRAIALADRSDDRYEHEKRGDHAEQRRTVLLDVEAIEEARKARAFRRAERV